MSDLPPEIRDALAPLAGVLATGHLSPVTWQYSEKAFGNFVVDFRGPGRMFTLTRDRGQFLVSGIDRRSAEKAGLCRAFDSAQALLPSLSSWLGH
ncbi:hypothetical protein LVB87_08560 [Lysobacter sp. KIS68-7]|uniref:hypothetical protein n=1 Tax=Lysobacter sp. KIS68-7 TaxID=2904252 RepID=UPI001E3D75F3|nr:hypothetical protein [Lysobacter sp. KIS68-7]UHQ18278.1 hypothetical protein LVB87_08560 [Lysobacter sp. KIS68-7]